MTKQSNFEIIDLETKVSELRGKDHLSRNAKGWDILNAMLHDSPNEEIHIEGIEEVSLLQDYKCFYSRTGMEAGFGNEEAEIVIKVENEGEVRYFKRTGIENSFFGLYWEPGEDAEETNSRFYTEDEFKLPDDSNFVTTEVKPMTKVVTYFG